MNELQQILAQLDKLTPTEQAEVQAYIQRSEYARQEKRKKELWGNVVAAMQKYEAEIKEITFMCPGNDYTCWCTDEIGIIEVAN